MKTGKLKDKKLLYIAIGCLIVSSLTVMASPYVDIEGTVHQKILSYIIGILFWISLICGWTLWFGLNWTLKKNGSFSKKKERLPGILRFFSTPQAIVSDCIFIISIILVLLSGLHIINSSIVEMISVTIMLITFHLH